MAAYRRVYDSRHLQADCPEPGPTPEPYAQQSSMGYLYLFSMALRGNKGIMNSVLTAFDAATVSATVARHTAATRQ